MGYSESMGCATSWEMSWAHLTHLEPWARSGHKGILDWASELMEGSLSTYGKGGSVSIAMNGFWEPDQIKLSNSSNLFLPSVCKSHDLCPACSSLQHSECSRHWGLGLDCLLWLFLSLPLSAMQSQEKLSLVLGCLKELCDSMDVLLNLFTVYGCPLHCLLHHPQACSGHHLPNQQPGELILTPLPMGRERGNKAPPKQTEQKPLFYVQALLSNNDLPLTTHSCLCLSPCLFMTFTHCILLNWACMFLTHRSCIFIHLW